MARERALTGRSSVLWRTVARPARFERVASTFAGWSSIQLSYGCILFSPTPADQRRSTDLAGISKFVGCDSVTNLVLRAATPGYPEISNYAVAICGS